MKASSEAVQIAGDGRTNTLQCRIVRRSEQAYKPFKRRIQLSPTFHFFIPYKISLS